MKSYRYSLNGLFVLLILILLQSCNYNYYMGLKLEEQGRYEEANIEFHRAYTASPGNEKYKTAYLRTAQKTTEDLLERYEKYKKEKKYLMAFRRLERANTLTPDHPVVKEEMKKWYRILLAGKVDLVEIRSLNNQVPLTDTIVLEIRFNTPNITRRLEVPIAYQSKLFSVEDVLYDPPQNLLMLYTINSIGLKLENSQTGQSQFKKFVDFKIPVLVDVQGALAMNDTGLKSVSGLYPFDRLSNRADNSFWHPKPRSRYSLTLNDDHISVSSPLPQAAFLPQMLYINKEDRRYFLDFGHLQLAQKRIGGLWTMRRHVTEDREYMKELRNNLILHPYFYYREGGYPFVEDNGG